MTKDEALRLALEALENITSVSICEATHHPKKDRHLLFEECPNEVRHLKAITAIKAALEAKDEPAAWMYPDDLKRFETSEAYAEAYSIEMVSTTQGETVPLYTTPPQRTWVGLTDEEIKALAKPSNATEIPMTGRMWIFAGDIEAKLKEKNT